MNISLSDIDDDLMRAIVHLVENSLETPCQILETNSLRIHTDLIKDEDDILVFPCTITLYRKETDNYIDVSLSEVLTRYTSNKQRIEESIWDFFSSGDALVVSPAKLEEVGLSDKQFIVRPEGVASKISFRVGSETSIQVMMSIGISVEDISVLEPGESIANQARHRFLCNQTGISTELRMWAEELQIPMAYTMTKDELCREISQRI